MASARRSVRMLALALVLCWGVGAGWLLFFPLPQVAVRGLVLSNASWIASDYMAAPDGALEHVRNLGRKLLAAHLQHSLVHHLEARQPLPEGLSDVERVVHVLARIRPLLVTANEMEQPVVGWQSLITGLGYCDQVNGVAAQALALYFSRAETYALVDPRTGISPHAIGRVWSEERDDWLYWDVFFGAAEVFGVKDGQVHLLASEGGAAPMDSLQGQRLAPVYHLIPHGRTLNQYHSTFGGYLAYKVRQSFDTRSTYALAPRPAPGMPGEQPDDERQEDLFHIADSLAREDGHRVEWVMRTYLDARMEHLLGDPGTAARAYGRVARPEEDERDARVRLIRKAAMVLGNRLATVSHAARRER